MLKIIRTETEYEAALEKAYGLIQKDDLKDKEADELELLTLIIEHYEKEHYEKEHYAVLPPKPIVAIKFRLEQLALNLIAADTGPALKTL